MESYLTLTRDEENYNPLRMLLLKFLLFQFMSQEEDNEYNQHCHHAISFVIGFLASLQWAMSWIWMQ